jgi:hypothetical protein
VTRFRIFVAATAAACSMFTMVGAQSAGAIRVNIRIPGQTPNFPPIGPSELLGVCLQTSAQPASCIII